MTNIKKRRSTLERRFFAINIGYNNTGYQDSSSENVAA